jgi:dolichol-phosphate mannosyltransferase
MAMLLSLVIPAYNEADALPALRETLERVLPVLDCETEILFIDDGSGDHTAEMIRHWAQQDDRVKLLAFSRNFGHQAAVTAGLDFAAGDAVVVMDADLQDPPELLPQMLELYRDGYDVVSAQRCDRACDGRLKRATAAGFYWLMRNAVDARLVPQVGDFRLFSRAAVLALRRFREQHRFMRGLVAWLGLKEAILPYRRQVRCAGATKYPLWKMLRFAWTAITSSSGLPLRATMAGGGILTAGGLLYALYVLFETLVRRATVPGWSSLVCLQVTFSGAILLAIGLVGDYLAKVYEESKGRPLYVLTEAVNVPTAGRVEPARVVVLAPSAIASEDEHDGVVTTDRLRVEPGALDRMRRREAVVAGKVLSDA